MLIVLCLNHFMPQHTAGTEVYTLALGKSLKEKGHEVFIVIPNYNSIVDDEYVYEGLTVKRYAEPNTIDKVLTRGKRPPDGIGAFEKLIKDIQPHIVHVQELAGSSGIGIYHLRLLKRMNIKVIFTMHLARYSCFTGTFMFKGDESCAGIIDIKRCSECALSRYPINSFLQKTLYNSSVSLYNVRINTGNINHAAGTALSFPFIMRDFKNSLFEAVDLCERVIILSDWYKKVLLANGVPEHKLHLVKQALPLGKTVKPVARQNDNEQIRLLFIGRIYPQKGIHLLLSAIDTLDENKIMLDIYGAVTNDAYTSSLKNKTGEKKNISWKGSVGQEEVINTISRYDALVLPSVSSEMSPLVIQEAFAAGVPVIGSDIAGIAEQIEDGKNGLLFKFSDDQSLKEVFFRLINNPLYLKDLKRNIIPPADFETVAEKVLQIYGDALSPVSSISYTG